MFIGAPWVKSRARISTLIVRELDPEWSDFGRAQLLANNFFSIIPTIMKFTVNIDDI